MMAVGSNKYYPKGHTMEFSGTTTLATINTITKIRNIVLQRAPTTSLQTIFQESLAAISLSNYHYQVGYPGIVHLYLYVFIK